MYDSFLKKNFTNITKSNIEPGELHKFRLLHGATAQARGSAKWVVDILKRDSHFTL